MPDLQSGGCRFESQPGLLRIKVYSAFHPSGVGKWVPAAAGKVKPGMAHSDCGWRCAGKTVKSLENTCHTWVIMQWWFTVKRRYITCMHLYLYLYHKLHWATNVTSLQPSTNTRENLVQHQLTIFSVETCWKYTDSTQEFSNILFHTVWLATVNVQQTHIDTVSDNTYVAAYFTTVVNRCQWG